MRLRSAQVGSLPSGTPSARKRVTLMDHDNREGQSHHFAILGASRRTLCIFASAFALFVVWNLALQRSPAKLELGMKATMNPSGSSSAPYKIKLSSTPSRLAPRARSLPISLGGKNTMLKWHPSLQLTRSLPKLPPIIFNQPNEVRQALPQPTRPISGLLTEFRHQKAAANSTSHPLKPNLLPLSCSSHFARRSLANSAAEVLTG